MDREQPVRFDLTTTESLILESDNISTLLRKICKARYKIYKMKDEIRELYADLEKLGFFDEPS